LQAVDEALPGICESFTDSLRLLNFGNAVGYFDIPGLGRVEVVASKWRRQDFDQLLAELTKVASGLPFAAAGTTALPYDRSILARQDVLYHAFT
jgi:hypothetical protein